MSLKRLYSVSAGLLLLVPTFLSLWAQAQLPVDTDRHTALVVFADRRIAAHLWPVLVETLERESVVASLTTPLDSNPHILLGGFMTPGPHFPDRIEVQLLGRCDVPLQVYRPLAKGPLGWVYSFDGHIQPDIRVDCTRLAQVITPVLLGRSKEQQVQLMSQAISNVIVHEWLHVVAQSAAHTSRGVCQARLSPQELVSSTLVEARPKRSGNTHLRNVATVADGKP